MAGVFEIDIDLFAEFVSELLLQICFQHFGDHIADHGVTDTFVERALYVDDVDHGVFTPAWCFVVAVELFVSRPDEYIINTDIKKAREKIIIRG